MNRHLPAVTVCLQGRHPVDDVTCIDVGIHHSEWTHQEALCTARSNRILSPWWQVRGTWCIKIPLEKGLHSSIPAENGGRYIYRRHSAVHSVLCQRNRISGNRLISSPEQSGLNEERNKGWRLHKRDWHMSRTMKGSVCVNPYPCCRDERTSYLYSVFCTTKHECTWI